MIRLIVKFDSFSYEVFTDCFDELKKEIDFLEMCAFVLDLKIKYVKIFIKGEKNEKN